MKARLSTTALAAAIVCAVLAAPAAGTDGARRAAHEPVFGRWLLAAPLRGEVSVATRPGAEPVRLHRQRRIPAGSLLDTTHGRVFITAATTDGATDTGSFRGGTFTLLQRAQGNGGLTVLRLHDGFGGCDATTGDGPSARLNAEAQGRWRTRGRFSSSTVHGTTWLTKDSCNSTTTAVISGTVVVRDRLRGESVRVDEGDRYVARRR